MSWGWHKAAAVLGTLALTPATGCRFDSSGAGTDGGPSRDATDSDGGIPDAAAPDSIPDANPCPAEGISFVPSNFGVCEVPNPQGTISVPSGDIWELNTDDGFISNGGSPAMLTANAVVIQSDDTELMVVAATQITVNTGGRLDIVGSRPVALVSYSNIDVLGTLQAGAVETSPGPGGNAHPDCATGTGAAGDARTTSGGFVAGAGAGGGAFGDVAGNGGLVDEVVGDPPAAAGGVANGEPTLSPLRGGCPGAVGGHTGGANPGAGGGGLQLVAFGVVSISASGAVGTPGGAGVGVTAASSGGGGGGSGGAILLEGSSIFIGGFVTSHGGGGGEGSKSTTTSSKGEDGHIGDILSAAGGAGTSSSGGDGGGGGTAAVPAQTGEDGRNNATGAGGGGGGGGSVGRIRLNSASGPPVIGGTVSPPAG